MRVHELRNVLAEGQFPPRWFTEFDGGYGSPYPSFYGMAFYYPAAGLYWLGVQLGSAIELTAFLVVMAAGLTMYLLVSKLWGMPSGILASILYLYAPYHLIDAFERGAYAELTAFVWFPLIFLFLVLAGREADRRWLIGAALSIAALLLTHNIMSLVFLPTMLGLLSVVVVWGQRGNRYALSRIASAGILGLLVSAFFWLPIVFESQYVHLDQFLYYDFHGDFVGVRALLGIQESPDFPLAVGGMLLILPVLSTVLALFTTIERSERVLIVGATTMGFLHLFMTTRFSVRLWEVVPLIEFVQFPWRMLAPASFFLAVSAGAIPRLVGRSQWAWLIAVGGAAVAIWQGSPLAHMEYRTLVRSYSDSDICREVWGTQDYRPRWSEAAIWRSSNKPDAQGNALVLDPCPEGLRVSDSVDSATVQYTANGTTWEIELSADSETAVMVPQFYYPGWRATIDGKPAQLEVAQPSGLIQLTLPRGNHSAVIWLEESPVRRLANLITLAGLGLIVAIATDRLPTLRKPP